MRLAKWIEARRTTPTAKPLATDRYSVWLRGKLKRQRRRQEAAEYGHK